MHARSIRILTIPCLPLLLLLNLLSMGMIRSYPEYVQLSLSIPGGGALQGQQYLAKLRIDDDDRHKDKCE